MYDLEYWRHDDPDGPRQRVPVPPEGLTIGRREDNGLVIPHPTVARHHARLVPVGDGFFAEDLQSHCGLFLDGERVQVTPLEPGRVLQVGRIDMRLVKR